MASLIKAYGGSLNNLVVPDERAELLKTESEQFVSITLTQRQFCDLELLLNGALSPLTGFMAQAEYDSVISNMRLPSGLLWSMPVTLDISEAQAEQLSPGCSIGLRDPEGFMLAVLHIEDMWRPDKQAEAETVYGTTTTSDTTRKSSGVT